MKQDISISMRKANNYAIGITLPLSTILLILYPRMWGTKQFVDGAAWYSNNILISIILFLIGIIVHEIIHGLSWQIFANKSRNSIKYGVDKKTLTPYVHCKEPIDIKAYRLGVIMPGFLLGLLPLFAGMILGNATVFLFGMIFVSAAGGDFLIIWLLRKVKPD